MEHFPPEYVNALQSLLKESFNPLSLFPVVFKYIALERQPVDAYSYQSLKQDVRFVLKQKWPDSPDSDLEVQIQLCLDHIGLIMRTVIVTLKQLGLNPDKMGFHSGSHQNLKFIVFEEDYSHGNTFSSAAYLP